MAVAKLGVVYTPRAVAAQIVERTLAPLVVAPSRMGLREIGAWLEGLPST